MTLCQGDAHTLVESLGMRDRQRLILFLRGTLQKERSTYRDRAKVTEQSAAEVK